MSRPTNDQEQPGPGISAMMNESPKKAMLTVNEVIEHYGISRSTWDRMVAAGKAPKPLKFGRNNRWRMQDLKAWEDAGQPLHS
ncbi:MAG TPA: transcriptional regulator [Planctomycetaceae bacterium]|nr:transcriptional regulator [Planctomycetaceae bacterium]